MLCVGGCKALRWQMQCFAMADAKLCDGTCNALRERLQCFASENGKTGRETVYPFRIKEKGGKTHNMGHCCPKRNYSRTNKASMLGAI